MSSKRSKSIVQEGRYCWICKKIGFDVEGTDLHHMMHGTANRKLADEDGLVVYLCGAHHRALHDRGEHDLELQQEAQTRWMEYFNKNTEDFIKRHGKNYL